MCRLDMLVCPLVIVFMVHYTSAFLQVETNAQDIEKTRCMKGQFPCNNSATCVDQRQTCDGKEDCEDGSDEMGCVETNAHQAVEEARCPEGYFPCNNSTTCIVQKKNCDKNPDCEDGSDEMGCDDQNMINYFNNMYRKRPDEDREKEYKVCELQSVPSQCRCSSYELFCEHKNLKMPPLDLPKNVQLLDLSKNEIEILEQRHFPLNEKLHDLILKNSKVALINRDAFKNLPSLKRLWLTNNQITTLMEGTMAMNEKLNSLDLSYNPLSVIAPGAFIGLLNLEELDLRHCSIKSLPVGVFDSLVNLQLLKLDNNSLTSITHYVFRNLGSLQFLYITFNEITELQMKSWVGLQNLTNLAISENKISALESTSFGNLSSLKYLDVKGNQIKVISTKAFVGLPNLKSLTLEKNELKKVSKAVFEPLVSLDYIYFPKFQFHMCSLAMHVRVCEPRSDGISSKEHLLDSVVLRVSVWGMACVAGLGNVAVLVGRLLVTEPNEVHSFYIKNLSLADLLMAVYLFCIAAHDLAFRGDYLRHEKQWRQSWQCNLCGFLSTLSSEASILILAVITTDRYMSILYPLSVKKRTLQSAGAAMAAAWGIGILFSALPILNIDYYGDEFYGNNGVCLPLHIHDPFGQAWEYTTFLFCGLNMATFLFILYAYISMFFTISHSKIGLRCTQQQQDRNIAKRFFFIVATDFLCWVPIIFIKVISMGGVPIQEDLYAWVAVFLLPVNSAINPILYTLTTKLFKQHLAMMVYNFKASTGESIAASCARNQSLKSQKNSFSQADHNHFALVMNRNCMACRQSNAARKSSSELTNIRRSSSKKTATTNVL